MTSGMVNWAMVTPKLPSPLMPSAVPGLLGKPEIDHRHRSGEIRARDSRDGGPEEQHPVRRRRILHRQAGGEAGSRSRRVTTA